MSKACEMEGVTGLLTTTVGGCAGGGEIDGEAQQVPRRRVVALKCCLACITLLIVACHIIFLIVKELSRNAPEVLVGLVNGEQHMWNNTAKLLQTVMSFVKSANFSAM